MTNVVPEPHPDSPETDAPVDPPPSAVAGVDALGDPDDEPGFEVRGTFFRVATNLPQVFLQRVISDSLKVDKMGKKVQRQEDGNTPVDPDAPATKKWERANTELIARSYDVMIKLVHPDEREDFEDWICDLDPSLEPKEQTQIMADATAAIAGRPTVPPPS